MNDPSIFRRENFENVTTWMNNNKYIAGIAMILFNIGSRFLVVDMNVNTENILKTKIMRRLTLFSIFFIGTRDLLASFVLTAVFVIITMNLFNEESSLCVIPHSFKDNIYTPEEYSISKRIISEYEKINQIHKKDQFCDGG
jgi:hypothetical protein